MQICFKNFRRESGYFTIQEKKKKKEKNTNSA